MASKELDKFERDAEIALSSLGGDVPVTEVKTLSPKVVEILLNNARTVGDFTYTAAGIDYTVSFGYMEIRQPDGRVGVYDEIPDDFEMKDAETIAFMVKGFHKNEATEVQFYEGKVELNRTREHKHIINFQRAVLMKGT